MSKEKIILEDIRAYIDENIANKETYDRLNEYLEVIKLRIQCLEEECLKNKQLYEEQLEKNSSIQTKHLNEMTDLHLYKISFEKLVEELKK